MEEEVFVALIEDEYKQEIQVKLFAYEAQDDIVECIYVEERKKAQNNKNITFFQVDLKIIYMVVILMANNELHKPNEKIIFFNMFDSFETKMKEDENKLKINSKETNHENASFMQKRLLCFSQFQEEIKFPNHNTRVKLRSKPSLHLANQP